MRHSYLTSHRVITETGLLSKNWKHASYSRITDVKFTQNLTERLYVVGDFLISTPGSDGYELELAGVDDPTELERFIAKKIEGEPLQNK